MHVSPLPGENRWRFCGICLAELPWPIPWDRHWPLCRRCSIVLADATVYGGTVDRKLSIASARLGSWPLPYDFDDGM